MGFGKSLKKGLKSFGKAVLSVGERERRRKELRRILDAKYLADLAQLNRRY